MAISGLFGVLRGASALPQKADTIGYGEWTDLHEENWTYEL